MLNRIHNLQNSLSSAECKVAQWVLTDPHRVVSATLAQIAKESAVSEPTVVRFCRTIGASGFRDFKTRLTQYLASSNNVVHANVAAEDTTLQVVTKVMGKSISELVGVQQRLNMQSIDQAVDALAAASRIEFYGIGASGYVAHDAQNKFFRLGLPCTAYSDSPTLLQAAAITNELYAIIAISKTGDTNTVVTAAKIAKDNGARVIAIASPRSALAIAANVSLLIDVDEDTGLFTPMSSRLAQLAVLDVLQVALALRLGDSVSENLDKTKRALQNPQEQ